MVAEKRQLMKYIHDQRNIGFTVYTAGQSHMIV